MEEGNGAAGKGTPGELQGGHHKPQRDWGEDGGQRRRWKESEEGTRGAVRRREAMGEGGAGRGGRRERGCGAGGPRAGSSSLPASLVDQGWGRRGARSQEHPRRGSVFKIPARAARPQHGTEGRREATGRARLRLWVPVRGRQRFFGAWRSQGVSSPHPKSRAVCQARDTAPLPVPASLRALLESLLPPKTLWVRGAGAVRCCAAPCLCPQTSPGPVSEAR